MFRYVFTAERSFEAIVLLRGVSGSYSSTCSRT